MKEQNKTLGKKKKTTKQNGDGQPIRCRFQNTGDKDA